MSIGTLKVDGASHDVLTGALVLPLRGAWEATLEIDADALPSGAVELTIARDDGAAPATYKGTIVSGATWGGRATVNVLAGAGRIAGPLAARIPTRSYVAAPLAVSVGSIVADIVSDAGEVLADGVAEALANVTVPRWLRSAGTAAAALNAALLALSWRALPDGTIWAGAETWLAADEKGLFQQGDDGSSSVLDVAPEHASILPGVTVQGRRIQQVVYAIGQGLRAELYYPEAA